MIDAKSQAALQEAFRRESRSLLSYVADAYPWTTATGEPTLEALNQRIRDETAAAAALGRFLVRHKVDVPLLGQYPVHFTSYNFVALSYLLPRLIDEERQSSELLAADVERSHDRTARTALEALLAVKRNNLAALEALQPQPATA